MSWYLTVKQKKSRYKKLVERDGLICRLCGKSVKNEWDELQRYWEKKHVSREEIDISLDHKMPRALLEKNGERPITTFDLKNLQIAHRTCNFSRDRSQFI